MSTLDKTREFEKNAVEELLKNGLNLMDTAIKVHENLQKDVDNLKKIYTSIAAEARDSALLNAIEDLQTLLDGHGAEEFEAMKVRLRLGLDKFLVDLPYYDTLLSEKIQESIDMTRNCIGMIDEVAGVIPLGMSGNYEAMSLELAECRTNVEATTLELTEAKKNLQVSLKGIEDFSAAFSKDPVNLTTGNFIYQKEDIFIKGRYPLSFRRFYNSVSERKGSLGPGWNHNYEIYVEEDRSRGRVRVILADGREDIFRAAEDGAFIPFWFCGSRLEKTAAGFRYTTYDRSVFLFDEEGTLIRQENRYGSGITFHYEASAPLSPAQTKDCHDRLADSRRVHRILEDTGNVLSFTYDSFGFLEAVADQTGRIVRFACEGGLLSAVTALSGGITAYTYDWQGRLEQVTDAEGNAAVVNRYDHRGRTLCQDFPDGGRMTFQYQDRKQTVLLTEQNGNQIRYLHDQQKRLVKTVYTDQDDKPLWEESFSYNNRNRRTTHTDRNGNYTGCRYDRQGNLTELSDALNRRTRFTYDGQGRVLSRRQADGSLYRYEYDPNGNLTAICDPMGRRREIAYEQGLPTVLCDPAGNTVTLSYDDKGNVLSVTGEAGGIIRYEYDALNRVIKTVDPCGRQTHYDYNEKGDIIRTVNAEGNSRTYEYDLMGRLTKVTDYNGGITAYRYNALGKPEAITGPGGGVTSFAYDCMWNLAAVTDPMGNSTKYGYDRHNRLTAITDQEGHITRFEHDPNGNVTAIVTPLETRTEIIYDSLNRRQEVRETDGAVTRFYYDAVSNLVKVVDPQGGETHMTYNLSRQMETHTDTLGNKTAYDYDVCGRLTAVTDPAGRKLTYRYGPDGRLEAATRPDTGTKYYRYDGCGNLTQVTDSRGNATAFTYDVMDRVAAVTSPLGESRRFTYDPLGNILSVTDENGAVTSYDYSPAGHLIRMTDPLCHTVQYSYDPAGRLTGMEQDGQVAAWEYDRCGRTTKCVRPTGEISYFCYDGEGNRISHTGEDGRETYYEYDPAGSLSRILYADGRTVELSYTPLRRLRELRDWLGTTAIETDLLGRAQAITDHEGRTVRYEWDELSRRTATVYPDGSRVDYRYHDTGQLAEVQSESGITRYAYDELGNLRERILSDQTVTGWIWDPLGRIAELSHQKDGLLLDRYRYTYDRAGRITGIDRYQRQNQNTAVNILSHYTYDRAGRLIQADRGTENGIRRYGYDGRGNRIYSFSDGKETTCDYDARNRLLRIRTGDDLTEYRHDPCGHLTQILHNGLSEKQFTFDAAGCLTHAVSADGSRAEYTYNGFLKRVRQKETIPAAGNDIFAIGNSIPAAENNMLGTVRETRYLLDLTKPYHDLLAVDGEENNRYIWGRELLLSEGETAFAYLSDHLGSPIRLTGGGPDEMFTYGEFGEPLKTEGVETDLTAGTAAGAGGLLTYQQAGTAGGKAARQNPFGFTGYQTDRVSGLYYAQARYYDSHTGRMISEDPVRAGRNWYAYCYNDPILHMDPSGLLPDWEEVAEDIDYYAKIVEKWAQEELPKIPLQVVDQVIDMGRGKGDDHSGRIDFDAAADVSWYLFSRLSWTVSAVSEVVKPYMQENYANNQDTFAGMINGQGRRTQPAAGMKIGYGNGADNGCGWIATYNAGNVLGQTTHPSDIIRYYEINGGTVLNGIGGVNPYSVKTYFEESSVDTNMINFPEYMDLRIRKSTVSILKYWHGRSSHFVAVEYINGNYYIYNESNDSEKAKQQVSIDDWLNDNGYTVLALITLETTGKE